MPVEEVKMRNLKSIFVLNWQDESKSPSGVRIDLSDNSTNQRYVESPPTLTRNSQNK